MRAVEAERWAGSWPLEVAPFPRYSPPATRVRSGLANAQHSDGVVLYVWLREVAGGEIELAPRILDTEAFPI